MPEPTLSLIMRLLAQLVLLLGQSLSLSSLPPLSLSLSFAVCVCILFILTIAVLTLSPSPPLPPPPSLPPRCEAGDLAGRLGPLPQSGQLNELDSTGNIVLEGLNSIVGRSVVIHEMGTNNNFECGTIRPQEELDGERVTWCTCCV